MRAHTHTCIFYFIFSYLVIMKFMRYHKQHLCLFKPCLSLKFKVLDSLLFPFFCHLSSCLIHQVDQLLWLPSCHLIVGWSKTRIYFAIAIPSTLIFNEIGQGSFSYSSDSHIWKSCSVTQFLFIRFGAWTP